MPVHFRQSPKKLNSKDANNVQIAPVAGASTATMSKAPKVISSPADTKDSAPKTAAGAATAASVRYTNHYLGVLENLRGKLKERMGDDPNPPVQDMQQMCRLLLEGDDEDFLIGLALMYFYADLIGNKTENIINRLVSDLQDKENWIPLPDDVVR